MNYGHFTFFRVQKVFIYAYSEVIILCWLRSPETGVKKSNLKCAQITLKIRPFFREKAEK